METSSLPAGWEVKVIFNFLIYNQLEDKYDSFQDGRVGRYHAMKTKWGITKCIDLKSFHDPLKGYLIDDTCVFGAEESYESIPFGDCNWKILFYPNGIAEVEGNNISIFISLPKSFIPDGTTKLFVKFILRVKNQIGRKAHWNLHVRLRILTIQLLQLEFLTL
ncbi:hypothetical protein Patl1_27031 [Pistacia atlantica]|uniref:Uncharacterized protein n=1 Tax=Pistacia atlantica TaxID=434234 RepID=A0ACC1AZF1_9ROSI|nr:hypothetical protein Patl1_27031 [Pistacia atlantica]